MFNSEGGRAEQIKRLMADFERKFKERTFDPDSFVSLYEIEQMRGELRTNTYKIYSDMLQLMSKVDETEFIRKKTNIKKKE